MPKSTDKTPNGLYGGGLKRLLDFVLALAFAPLVLPLIAGLLLFVALGRGDRDRGAPLYGQKRVGRGGRIFTCWKIRTMIHDAETHLDAHLESDPDAAAEWARDQKLRDDPRVTAAGRVLRATSLDELPQLWNVLAGDMSLVGPRPFMPDQLPLYPDPDAYMALRPGITGLWQVGTRNDGGFAERATYDARYLRDLSLGLDLSILLRTVRVVLRAGGR